MGRGVGNDVTCKVPAAQQLRRKRADKRRAKNSRGAPLISADSLAPTDRLVRIPEDIGLTMAPTGRWIEYAERLLRDPSRLVLNKARADRLRRFVAKLAKSWHGGIGPAPLSGTGAEHMFAEAIEPPTRSKAKVLKLNFKDKNTPKPRGRGRANEKAYYDVVLVHPDDEGRNIAWEVKVLNNHDGRNEAVLMTINASDIGYTPKMKPRDVAERVFSAIREKQEAAMEQLSVTDSRALFFWGEGKGKTMLIWQEPYYPGEIDLDDFEWVAKEGSICGYRGDQLIWSWYPRGGNVKHKVHVPEELATSVRLPKESFTLEEHLKRMAMKLPA